MVVVTSLGYLTLDNKKYAATDFKSFSIPLEIPQLKAKRVQSPFIDFEITDFSAGIRTADGDDAGNWYRAALGMEATGPDAQDLRWLKCGRQLQAFSDGGNIWDAFQTFEGALYGCNQSGTDIRKMTSANVFSQAHPMATGIAFAIVEYMGNLVAFGTQSDIAYSVDGAAWTDKAGTRSGTAENIHSAITVNAGGTTPRVYYIVDRTAGAELRYISGLAILGDTLVGTLDEQFSVGAITTLVADLYLAGCDTNASSPHGKIYRHTIGGANLDRIATFEDNYPVSAATYKGKTYWGMKLNGEVWSYDPTDGLQLVKQLGTSITAISGMAIIAGALWLCCSDGTNSYVWRFDGSSWSQPHYLAEADATHRITSFAGAIYLSTDNGGVYKVHATSRVTAAQLEFPDVVYGVPGTPKAYVEFGIQHSALLSGQTVQGRYKLDDGSEVTLTTNSNVDDRETVIRVPAGVSGGRLRPKIYLVNGASQDLTVFGGRVRAVAMPGSPVGSRVWEATLHLHRDDLIADGLDDFQKYSTLAELKKTGRIFQAVGQFQRSSQPTGAMLALFDPQANLQPRFTALRSNADTAIEVPVRLLQASGAVLGLLNGSFEQDAAGAAPTSWALINTPTSANVSTAVTAPVGTKVLAVVFDGVDTSAGRSQAISGLTALRYYTVGGYIRRTTTGAGTVRINVTGTGLDVGTPLLAAATDTEFQWYEICFQLPSGTTAITIRLVGESTPAGTCYFDGIRLEE